jgi:hypothetical protein
VAGRSRERERSDGRAPLPAEAGRPANLGDEPFAHNAPLRDSTINLARGTSGSFLRLLRLFAADRFLLSGVSDRLAGLEIHQQIEDIAAVNEFTTPAGIGDTLDNSRERT